MTNDSIQRYTVSGDIAYPINEDPEGDYVTYEDHVAAIEADRKRRGEPAAWRYLTPTGWHATTDAARALGVAEHHTVEPLYADYSGGGDGS